MTIGATHTLTVILKSAGNDLPGWLRVALWGWSHADRHGHAQAWSGQLKAELKFASASDMSRAVRQARERGLVDECSTSSCVVLPGRALEPCEAPHREATTT